MKAVDLIKLLYRAQEVKADIDEIENYFAHVIVSDMSFIKSQTSREASHADAEKLIELLAKFYPPKDKSA